MEYFQPLSPAYDFGHPGQDVIIFEGLIAEPSNDPSPGRVTFKLTPRPDIDWSFNTPHISMSRAGSPGILHLHGEDGVFDLSVWHRNQNGGWTNGTEVGERDRTITHRLIAHWLNLPYWPGSVQLHEEGDDGSKAWWSGRSILQILDWQITLDSRSDRRSWKDFHEHDVYLLTHVMEIVRTDESNFAVAEAEKLIAALHISTSFAMARWAAPVLPVAYDTSGKETWKEWRPPKCDRGRQTGQGWWYESDFETLSQYLYLAVPALLLGERSQVLKTQMLYAIAAASENALLEQRIMTAAAGLEHFSWEKLVLQGELTKKEYNSSAWNAAARLRHLLVKARIATSISEEFMPASTAFAESELIRTGDEIDGPELVVRVRNRLIHPKDSNDRLSAHDGLLTEVWLLAKYYLELLILESIDFEGHIRDTRIMRGWAGAVVSVPWANPQVAD